MRPFGNLSRLVAALMFRLLDHAGRVVAELGTTPPTPYSTSYLDLFNDTGGRSRLEWDTTGARLLSLGSDPSRYADLELGVGHPTTYSLTTGSPAGRSRMYATVADAGLSVALWEVWAGSRVAYVDLTASDPSYSRAAVVADSIDLIGDVNICPVGTVIAGIWPSSPPGFLLLNGQHIVGARLLFPALWAVAGAWQINADDLVLPDLTGRTLVGGSSVGGIAGANTHTLAVTNLPSHSHSMAHTHAQSANGEPGYMRRASYNGTNWDASFVNNGVKSVSFHNNAQTGGSSAANTGTAGSGTPVDHTPAHMVVRYAVRAL